MNKLKTVADYYRFFQKNHELIGCHTALIRPPQKKPVLVRVGDILPVNYNYTVSSGFFSSANKPNIEITNESIRIFQKSHQVIMEGDKTIFYVKGESVKYFELTEEERFQDSVLDNHYSALDELYNQLQTIINNNEEYF